MKLKTVLMALLLGLLAYQQCAKVHFVESDSEGEASENLPKTDPGAAEFQGNGQLYTGQYVIADHEDQCVNSDVFAEVHQEQDLFFLVKDRCEVLQPRVSIENSEIETLFGGTSLVFRGELLVNLSEDYDQYLEEFPSSCLAIFEAGQSKGNGSYYIDASDGGRGEIVKTYCNMEFISGGWSPWSDWSTCSAACGDGVETRTRQCETNNCSGVDTESRSCKLKEC